MPKEGTAILTIRDIGEEEQESNSEVEVINGLHNVQIVGVPLLHSYKACLQCKARVEPLTPPLGRCSKPDCGMIQRYDICTSQVSAKLLVMYSTNESGTRQYKSLQTLGSTVGEIANVLDREVTAADLHVLAPAILKTISYSDTNIITGFHQAVIVLSVTQQTVFALFSFCQSINVIDSFCMIPFHFAVNQ